jgi:hypothetical protein
MTVPVRNAMIRDTSATDSSLAPPPRPRGSWRWLLAAGLAALLVAGLVAAWTAGEHSVDAERLRFAEVVRGNLVRDAAVNGRVIATAPQGAGWCRSTRPSAAAPGWGWRWCARSPRRMAGASP